MYSAKKRRWNVGALSTHWHMDLHGGHAVLPEKLLQNFVSSAAQGKLSSADLEQETREVRCRGPHCPFVFPNSKRRLRPNSDER